MLFCDDCGLCGWMLVWGGGFLLLELFLVGCFWSGVLLWFGCFAGGFRGVSWLVGVCLCVSGLLVGVLWVCAGLGGLGGLRFLCLMWIA